MTKKYLYGNLNQDTVRPNYGGSTTDSLVINVDNDNMIISGEVKWDGALGEIAHKAYPGDKGARNYSKILELTALLEEEIANASKSRDSVESKVGALEKSFKELDAALTTAIKTEAAIASETDELLLTKCRVETERALEAETKLLTELKAEVEARETVDADLIQRLDNLSGLSVESLDEVRTLVVNEVTRAQQAEEDLRSDVRTESQRALNAESKLQDTISSIDNKIDESVEGIDLALETERSERVLSDDIITELVETESTRAQEAEATLLSNISTLNESVEIIDSIVTELHTLVTQNDSADKGVARSIAELEKHVDSLDTTVSTNVTRLDKDIADIKSTHESDKNYLQKQIDAVDTKATFNTELVSTLSGKLKDINKHLSTLDVSVRNNQAAVEYEAGLRQSSSATVEKRITTLDKKVDTQRAQLEESLADVDNKTVSLANSILIVDSAVKSLSSQVATLYQADVVTEEEFNELNEQLKTVYNNISSLTQTVEDEVARSVEKDAILDSSISKLNIKLVEVDNKHLIVSQQIQTLTSVIDTLAVKIVEVASAQESLLHSVDQLTLKVSVVETALESERELRAQSTQELNEKIETLGSQVKELEPEIDQVKQSVASIDTSVQNLMKQKDETADELDNLQSSIDAVNDRISGVQTQLDNTTDRVDEALESHRIALVKHDVSTHQHDVDIADLQDEIHRLDDIDSEIKESIHQTKEQATEDRDLHTAHYHELVSRLEQEIKRSIAADASLLTDTSRNSGRITALQIDLTNVISKYVDELTQADQQLNDKIDYEHLVAEEYKEKLLEEVADVETASLQRDNTLQAQIEILAGKKDSVPLIENEGDMPEVYAQQGDKTFTIPAERAVVAEALVRRDSAGNILLSTDNKAFTIHSAVSRLFVENIIAELRDEISSISFDFIDGGNAPIG